MKVVRAAVCLIAVIIVASCSKKNNPQPGIIPIPNGDFENWTGTDRLQNWTSNSCPECVPPFETYIVQKDSNAYHGKYAAKLVYNDVYAALAENKFFIPSHPVSLTAYIKSAIAGADTVSIKIRLYKNNAVADSGLWLGTSSVDKYAKINIAITQSSMQVDSAKITITGGHVKGALNNNTTFWVDHLSLQ